MVRWLLQQFGDVEPNPGPLSGARATSGLKPDVPAQRVPRGDRCAFALATLNVCGLGDCSKRAELARCLEMEKLDVCVLIGKETHVGPQLRHHWEARD